jgi:hypothetical protein
MKIVHVETLISKGAYPKTKEWADIRQQLQLAISDIDCPHFSQRKRAGKLKALLSMDLTSIEARLSQQQCVLRI